MGIAVGDALLDAGLHADWVTVMLVVDDVDRFSAGTVEDAEAVAWSLFSARPTLKLEGWSISIVEEQKKTNWRHEDGKGQG